MSDSSNPVNTVINELSKVVNQPQVPSVDTTPQTPVTNGNSKLDVSKPIVPPRQQKKPFWKSKGFWGGVISVASAVSPVPVRPVIAIAGGLLGMYGRATAQGPLTTQDNGGQ